MAGWPVALAMGVNGTNWKVRKNLAAGRGELGTRIIHFQNAFHGRSGYTLSLTNSDPIKTEGFPQFAWPRS